MRLCTPAHLLCLATLLACMQCDSESDSLSTYPEVNRAESLPADIEKRGPATDFHPPILHSTAYEDPVPLAGAVNTAGAEDSPFVLPDGETLYFFFTPDVRVPMEQQVLNETAGVWVSRKSQGQWGEAERVWLQDPGKIALDGAVCVQGDEMWFASVREGYTGVNMFQAERINDLWQNWVFCGNRLMQEMGIGEVHLHGDDLYYHSNRAGGRGDLDLWQSTRSGDEWSEPVNLEALNTAGQDAFPFVSSDGNQLWFSRTLNGTPAIYMSEKDNGNWGEPELIVSQFAGEATLDDSGNLYFVHHYVENDVIIEADIYVAYKR